MADQHGFIAFIWQIVSNEFVKAVATGALGAVVASMVRWNSWIYLFRTMVVGAACASFFSKLSLPLIVYILHGLQIENIAGEAPSLSRFFMGLFGFQIIELIIEKIGQKAGEKPLLPDRAMQNDDNFTGNPDDFIDEDNIS